MDINNNNNNDLSEKILITLRQIARAMSIYSKSLDKHFGLTSPQLIILQELSQAGQMAIGANGDWRNSQKNQLKPGNSYRCY